MNPPISILLISYNTRDITLACLRSIYEQTSADRFELIVVDNNSTDGSAAAIAEQFPQARLFALQQNLGFAGANILAAKEARGEWLLLLNPDTVILDRAIERLADFANAHPEAHIFGGRTLFPDHSLNPTSCFERPTFWNVFCVAVGLNSAFPNNPLLASECYGGWKRDVPREVDIVTGCFFYLRRSLWDELGGFDPAFFMYGEEADLCLRAADRGKRCMITPDATIIHLGGASEKVRADKMVKLFNAKALLFRRHWSPAGARVGIFLLDYWAFSRVVIFGILSRFQARRRESFATWKSIWSQRTRWHVLDQAPQPPAAVGAAAASLKS